VPATDQTWPLKNDHALAKEEISFTRLQVQCDVIADRSDRELGQPN
jgi:hypothetical protein